MSKLELFRLQLKQCTGRAPVQHKPYSVIKAQSK